MSSKVIDKIDRNNLPKHIAIIMDGNGRWAREKNKPRFFGHRAGVKTVRRIVEASVEIGLEYLTLYTFSTENWKRPPREISALMNLLVVTIRKELEDLNKNNVSVRVIGESDKIPSQTLIEVNKAIETTKNNAGLKLIMALSYSSRWDIISSVKKIIELSCNKQLNPETFTEDTFKSFLSTSEYPDPELLIRTSGECRISNFLLWELAYSELFFTEIKWPDFSKDDFFQSIVDYQQRERRFGKVSEQLKKQQ